MGQMAWRRSHNHAANPDQRIAPPSPLPTQRHRSACSRKLSEPVKDIIGVFSKVAPELKTDPVRSLLWDVRR